MIHYKNKRGNEVVNKVMSINTGKKQNEQLQKKMAFNGSIILNITGTEAVSLCNVVRGRDTKSNMKL